MVQAHRLTQDREQKPIDTDRSSGYAYKCFFLPILDPPRNSVGKHRKQPRIWIQKVLLPLRSVSFVLLWIFTALNTSSSVQRMSVAYDSYKNKMKSNRGK